MKVFRGKPFRKLLEHWLVLTIQRAFVKPGVDFHLSLWRHAMTVLEDGGRGKELPARSGWEPQPRFASTFLGRHADRAQPSCEPSGQEVVSRNSRASDDGLQRSDPKLRVIRHRNRDRRVRKALLHDDVAPSTAHLTKSVDGQDLARVLAREDSHSTQQEPRRE